MSTTKSGNLFKHNILLEQYLLKKKEKKGKWKTKLWLGQLKLTTPPKTRESLIIFEEKLYPRNM